MALTDKVERDWYLSYLIKCGVCVEYWDITGMLFPAVKFQKSLERDYLIIVNNYEQLEELLASRDIPNTSFVMMINYEGRFNRLFSMLSRLNCKLFIIEWGNMPVKSRTSIVNRCAMLVKSPGSFFASLQDKLKREYATRLGLVKPFDVVFAAGAASMILDHRAGKLVAVNLCDYDNYLIAQETPCLLSSLKYAVFLDINLAFQSDLKIVGWAIVNSNGYANSLNSFFMMLEERHRIKVVIAAHPKATYDESYFGGRTLLKGVTPELVKDAEFVISHHSTSISYAVLNRKPLLFIYTEEMKKIYADTVVSYIHDFAEYLGQSVINVDEVKDASDIHLVEPDPVRYDSYKYNYLTSKESEGRLNRDIVLAELTA
jgi:hypothetical protein